MEELIVEGLTPEDFKLLKEILSEYKVSINSTTSFVDVLNLYTKVSEIVSCLEQ